MNYYNPYQFYQPQPYQPMPAVNTQPQQAPQAPQADTSPLIWIQGEAGAKAYMVAPNNTVVLWDSENPTIYIKTADATGLPTMRVLDWTERNAKPIPQAPAAEYVTRTEFDELKKMIDEMKGSVANA